MQTAMPTMPANPSPRSNWSGNYRYHATEFLTPRTIDELQQMVAAATHCKALGSRHSFQGIADTPGAQISLEHLREWRGRRLRAGRSIRTGARRRCWE